jgi:hypothetical protein
VSAPRRDRWYGSMRVLTDDRLRFSPWTFPGLPHVAIWESSMSISVLSGGRQLLLIYPERKRVRSACFVYTLKPDELREAVGELRTVRGGLERWIVPALEWTQADLLGLKLAGHPGHELVKVIPELLNACRHLPVARSWRRKRDEIQRHWAQRLRQHPEDIVKVKAPWMLPEGFTLDRQPAVGTAAARPRAAGACPTPRTRPLSRAPARGDRVRP